ncbi:hypothetical protein NF212_24375 [Parasalinivibrio latis]|uniref:hypothetical protein n=1 Tax=Parasalinivibrio latis TaxID=2952610 RepID=UPI0030DF517A
MADSANVYAQIEDKLQDFTTQLLRYEWHCELCTLKGFTNSIFMLMDIFLASPSYRSVKKRVKKVDVR